MADLTGTTPADTYKGLLQVNDYADGIANNTGSSALAIQDGAGNATALAISTDRVGIGTTSPIADLHVNDGDSASQVYITSSDTSIAGVYLGDQTRGFHGGVLYNNTTDSLGLWAYDAATLTAQRMTIDSNGNVTPGTDDAQDFGSSTKRWDDIYATNTTIQASDRELKQDIEELSEAETRVAQACKGLLRKYRWKSSVAEKGDDARIHFGIMAQDLEAAFAAEGLDAGRYGMFIKNTWWEADRVVPAVEAVEAVEAVYDEEGNEVSPAVEAVEAQPERTELDIFNNIEDAPEGATEVTQRGVRYAELLAFIIAAI